MGFQVQGQTFKAPTAVVMDFQNSKESSMCYVALSRVQELSQVFIVDKLHEDCAGWKVSSSALDELNDSMKLAINTKTEEEQKLEILCLNVRSLRQHMRDVEHTVRNRNISVICLQETWLCSNYVGDEYKLENFQCDLTSIGRGKGIATYYKTDFKVHDKVCSNECQFAILTSDKLSVINIYRSSGCKDFCEWLQPKIIKDKPTIICGDFNTDYRESDNRVSRFLKEKMKFRQIVVEVTHELGSLLDQVWINKPLFEKVEVEQTSLRFSDHDMLKIVVNQ